MFAIEQNIQIPTSRGPSRTPTKYPFRVMQVGESFAVPIESERGSRVQVRVAAAASYVAKKIGRKFTTRVTGQAVRCWRVA